MLIKVDHGLSPFYLAVDSSDRTSHGSLVLDVSSFATTNVLRLLFFIVQAHHADSIPNAGVQSWGMDRVVGNPYLDELRSSLLR